MRPRKPARLLLERPQLRSFGGTIWGRHTYRAAAASQRAGFAPCPWKGLRTPAALILIERGQMVSEYTKKARAMIGAVVYTAVASSQNAQPKESTNES
jgi:hypothetical protein